MSQFYAEIQGGKGMATRTGNKISGIWGHVRGWKIGVLVEIEHINTVDRVKIFKTGGSNNPFRRELIAEFSDDDIR